MCTLYGVTRGGFYAWQRRTPSTRALEDLVLLEQVRHAHEDSRGYYGSPRIAGKLRDQGVDIGKRRVARLMRQAQIQGRSARLYRRSKIGQRTFFASVPNRQREVQLSSLNQVWVGDVTYLRAAGRWRYLAAVMDKHSRRIVGWSLGEQRDAALTRNALANAVRKRAAAPGLLFHTDRGIEYAAHAFKDKLARYGFVQSMNRPGTMNDNAHMESFFHSMKCEALYGLKFDTDAQLRQALLSYIQFYNHERLHSSLRYLAPSTFEQRQALQPCVN